jgi:hypothetical protein
MDSAHIIFWGIVAAFGFIAFVLLITALDYFFGSDSSRRKGADKTSDTVKRKYRRSKDRLYVDEYNSPEDATLRNGSSLHEGEQLSDWHGKSPISGEEIICETPSSSDDVVYAGVRYKKYDKIRDWDGKCPKCGCGEFMEGPCGGGSINIQCSSCGKWYNEMGPFGLEII